MAFPCSSSSFARVRPPRAAQRPRGSRPALTVVAAASGAEARASLVLALASQALAASQRGAVDLVTEAAKYALPSGRFEPRTLEEALMSGQSVLILSPDPKRLSFFFCPKTSDSRTCAY